MKYALLIHGPYSEQWLSQIKKSILKFKNKFNQIVIVSYTSDIEQYRQKLKEIKFPKDTKIVPVKDTINPGFFNINRQIISVNEGLKFIEDGSYVFKLRNDQCVDFNKIIKYIDDEKIITTNCYSRKDRLYHPSDMFLAAEKKYLQKMYSIPLTNNSHLMTQMECFKIWEKDKNINYPPISPESELCRHYLKECGWSCKNTKEDSLAALQKYYIVLNSWNIDFKWKEQRTNMFPKGSLILPHYFSAAVFGYGPTENASCYLQSDISKTIPNFVDIFYLFLSKFVWLLWKPNKNNAQYVLKIKKIKKIRYKVSYKFLELFPYFIVKKQVKRYKEKFQRLKSEGI